MKMILVLWVLSANPAGHGAAASRDFAPYENFQRSISGSGWSYHFDFSIFTFKKNRKCTRFEQLKRKYGNTSGGG
ncbi:hypothetical protein EZX93_21610 [Salmonella enterica subsp. enterica serovar Hvittingfoss]|nr:hypothetical protein [Salmonella enterica subsp. enterica serovar Hvittingfoss]ECP2961890.1 hypothetical protein [Salmonella enterica]EEP8337730.1 hypothetical protein [Salmonella enterica subsp. enterica serovar Bonn]ECB6005733.1 hypothetical protein [Salmonella enterica subsp. enterica serovar Hvittingfoss]ECF0465025.1 hypothetical protein [Salmonella enterica subsp. enterica serovar Hvittingfoss]